MKKMLTVLLGAACLLALAGCAGEAPAEITGLDLGGQTTLAAGQSIRLPVSHLFEGGAPTEEAYQAAFDRLDLVWTSSDETVATAEENRVTGVGPGSAEITASDADGRFSASATMVVVAPIEHAAVPKAVTLALGADAADEAVKLAPSWQPAVATGVRVAYASGDEAVVKVAADGTLTPVGAGEAEVLTTIACDSTDHTDGTAQRLLRTRVTVTP